MHRVLRAVRATAAVGDVEGGLRRAGPRRHAAHGPAEGAAPRGRRGRRSRRGAARGARLVRAGHLSRKPARGRGPSAAAAAARRSVDPAAAAAAGRQIRARVGAGAAVSGGRAALLGAHVRLAPGRARARRPELREGGSERAGPRLRGRPTGAPARPGPPPGAPRGGRCPARALLAAEAGGLTRAREARRGRRARRRAPLAG